MGTSGSKRNQLNKSSAGNQRILCTAGAGGATIAQAERQKLGLAAAQWMTTAII
jgi:hypothetical protein